MLLEEYFDFLNPDDIRIKGHRIGIDNVIDYYLQGCHPEQIQDYFPTLSLEQIYATITYYLKKNEQGCHENSFGKPKKVALTACIHKLLIILNAMVRDGCTWQPRLVS